MMLSVLLWIGGIIGTIVSLYLVYMVTRTVLAGRGGRVPEGISVITEVPARVRVEQQVSLVVRVANSLDRTRVLINTDMDDSLARGFSFVSIEPVPTRRSTSAKLGTWVITHQRPIGPRETIAVTFILKALRPGTFGGNICVYVDGDHFRWLATGVVIHVDE